MAFLFNSLNNSLFCFIFIIKVKLFDSNFLLMTSEEPLYFVIINQKYLFLFNNKFIEFPNDLNNLHVNFLIQDQHNILINSLYIFIENNHINNNIIFLLIFIFIELLFLKKGFFNLMDS